MEPPELSKEERKRLIRKISEASGVAQYALLEKMMDEDVLKASEHLEIFKLIKSSNTYNRYCQGKKTQAANEKLKAFMNPGNSEIINAGKWLMNALSKKGSERQQSLLEKDLVHKDDYNGAVSDLRDTIVDLDQNNQEMTDDAQQRIIVLQKRIDTLRYQQSQIKDYISNNHGFEQWKLIAETFDIEADG